MSSNEDEYDVTESDQNVEGDIGVSSERTGPTGPGQHAATGVRDTSEVERDPDEDVPPEQAAGGEEVQPDGLEPKADYPSLDPRSD
jgi:hypothetical protein